MVASSNVDGSFIIVHLERSRSGAQKKNTIVVLVTREESDHFAVGGVRTVFGIPEVFEGSFLNVRIVLLSRAEDERRTKETRS